MLANLGGVTRENSYDHMSEFLLELLEVGVDIVHLPESNVDWRHPNQFKSCRSAVKSVFKHAKLATSSSNKRFNSPKQSGGTLTIAVDNITGRVFEAGRDSTLGRWSYLKTRGRNGRRIVSVTVYQVCEQDVTTVGPLTACSQQQVLLDEQNRLTTRPNGLTTPHPRQALIQDLSIQLHAWQTDGYDIILSGDLNEVLGEDPDLFSSIALSLNLVDVFRDRHGMIEPATYNRGHRRLDYTLVSSTLVPAVTACGILPFDALSPSDHRALFVDFDTYLLFGSLPSELAPSRAPIVHSRDYTNSTLYIQTVHNYCTTHQLFTRAEDASFQATPTQLNNLDREIGLAMQAGVRALRRRYRTPFTPAMRQARLLKAYLSFHLTQFKTNRSKKRAIQDIQPKLDVPPTPPLNEVDCHQQLKSVQSAIRTLRKSALENRKAFLSRQVDFESSGNPEKAQKIRERILKAEEIRRVCSKIRHLVSPNQTAGLNTVMVPLDHSDPKQARTWRTVDDPTEVVRVIQARNQQHFSQAQGTPFTSGELSSIPFEASGPLADSILSGQYHSSDPILDLFLRELSHDPAPPLPPIADLTSKVIARFKSWDETTSVSPFSERYLAHYISLIRALRTPPKGTPPPQLPPAAQLLASNARALLDLHTQLLSLAITHQHSYSRWQQVANLMLEKDFGIPKIHRLRIIHLYEADLNLLLGVHFARALVSHIESHNKFNPGCYGNRPGLSAHEPVFVEEIQNSISYLSRTNRIDLDNDATACYDRIPPNLANLCARHNGMAQAPCSVHGKTLQNMSYHLLTALGISDQAYSNGLESPVYGTGQGSTYSPTAWGQIVSKLFDAHGRRAHGAKYFYPDQSVTVFLHMLGYVDDTKNHVNDFDQNQPVPLNTLVSRMEHDSQLWSDLLHQSGAKLEISKMYFYVSRWVFDPMGKPSLDDDLNVSLLIQSPNRTSTTSIPNKSVNNPRRTLGPVKCPGRNPGPQLHILQDKSDNFAKMIQSSNLTRSEAWTAYFSFYLPMMTYVLHTSFFTEAQLTRVEKLATTALFRKSGFNKTTANAVKFGPPRLGGIGFRHLYTEQSLLLVKMAQINTGLGTPLLEFPEAPTPLMEDAFLQELRRGMIKLGASLRINNLPIRPLARQRDFYLMEAVLALSLFSPTELERINYCRLYLGLYLASDLVNPDGTTILRQFFHGSLSHRPNRPKLKFPRQPRPHSDCWALWRRALRQVFTAPRSTSLELLHPLGPWFPLRRDSQLWEFYRTKDSLIQRTRITGQLREFHTSTHDRRYLHLPQQPFTVRHSLPRNCHPVSPPLATRSTWLLTPAFTPPTPQVAPATESDDQFTRLIQALDPSIQTLVSQHKFLRPLPEIRALLATATKIYLVGDGGAKTSRASFGAVLAADDIRFFQVSGPVSGPDPRSYRAEAYAMAAASLSFVLITTLFSPTRPCSFTPCIYSDNQGLITKVSEARHWTRVYSSAALLPEWDILSVILDTLPKFPSTPTVTHVKGHQDSDRSRHTLPLPAQLNCEADDLATAALQAIQSPSPYIPVFPTARCQLDIGTDTCTRSHLSRLRASAGSPALRQYLQERNNWSPRVYASVHWEAFSSAQFSTPSPSFPPKYCHRHLPVGRTTNRNNPKYSPTCHSCGDPNETDNHLLVCNSPSRQRWRHKFLTALLHELNRLHTDPHVSRVIVTTLRLTLEGKETFPPLPFPQVIASQSEIGWLSALRGYWSKEWQTLHLQQLRLVPHPDQSTQARRLQQAEAWLPTVARFVMGQCHKLWILRNTERHGITPTEREVALRVTAQRELAILYELRPLCEPRIQQLFLPDVATHFRQTVFQIRNWILLYEQIIHNSCRRRKEAFPPHAAVT